MKEKPVLFPDTRTDAQKFDPRLHRGTLDPSRIPGYSEIVQANDIDKADDLWFREQNKGRTKEDLYREIGATPQELPVEYKWLPVSGVAGGDMPSSQARILDRMKNAEGFRIVPWTKDADGNIEVPDLDRYGYGYPPNGRFAEDGTIRRGPDTALFVRGGEVARMWEKANFEDQAQLENPNTRTSTAGAYSTEVHVGDELDRETVTLKH